MTQTLNKPWALFFVAESGKKQCLCRFVLRSEAEQTLLLVKRQIPHLNPELVFDRQEP